MRILILGGTGAMGIHVTRILADAGNDVVVTSRKVHKSDGNIRFMQGDSKSIPFLKRLLVEQWDAIVDFMIWSTHEFLECCPLFLSSTDQYVFLSSYRVYADSPVLTEESPRLLDVCGDKDYLSTDEYALAKARCEDILRASGQKNWTIVRPAITYDGAGRFQLTVHEADVWLWRAQHGIPVPLPECLLDKQTTMTWGGDVARMIAALLGNRLALGEIFTVSTSEHCTWEKIVEIYQKVVPQLEIFPCDIALFEREHGAIYQIRYDRMLNRVIDNSKILATTKIKQSSFKTIEQGLYSELVRFLKRNKIKSSWPGLQAKMDRIVGGSPSFLPLVHEKGKVGAVKYLVRRFVK